MSIWDGFRHRSGSDSLGKEKRATPSSPLPPRPASASPSSSSSSSSSSSPSSPAGPPRKQQQQRQDMEWNAVLERRLKQTLQLLKALTKQRKKEATHAAATSATMATATTTTTTAATAATEGGGVSSTQAPTVDAALEAQSKRVGESVKELLPTLALPTFTYGSGRRGGVESSSGLHTARKFFLDLWHLLVLNIEVLDAKHQKHAYEAISYVVTREEFDVARMGLHHDQLRIAKDELLVVHRYRILLFHTQAFVNIKLSEAVEKAFTPPYYLTQFCARMLAINFFRLPGVSQVLIQAIALTAEQLSELETYLLSLQRPTSSARLPIGDHRPGSPRGSFSDSPAPLISSSPPTIGSKQPLSLVQPSDSSEGLSRSLPTPSKLSQSPDSSPSLRRATSEVPNGANSPQMQRKDSDVNEKQTSQQSIDNLHASQEGDTGDVSADTHKESEVDEKGDGRSARRYTFIQGRCYYLVTQPENGGRTKRSQTISSSPSPASTQGRNPLSSFPNLTSWNMLHAALLSRIFDNEDEKLRLTPHEWIKILSQRDRLYFIFLRDWVDHILYNTQGRPLEWSGAKGYIPLLLGFIFELRARKHLTKPMLDCTNAFLATDPALLNLFVKMTFSRTKLYDALAVADTLSYLESWAEQFRADERPLPPSFDYPYLVDAFELIMSTEHHQLLLKLLMFLYQYSEVFVGEARVALYSEFLLDRHFFYFFLHWDINVRNAFHQLLAYKMLRSKRSQLQGQGLRVRELSNVRNKNGVQLNDRLSQSTSSLIDRELTLDLVLYEKMEEKFKVAGNQMRGLVKDCYPSSWEVYVPVALSEYKRYLALYYQWESSDKKPPRLQPVAVADRTPPPVPIQTHTARSRTID